MTKILIHTNKYSGNFEREICAFATGQYGECGVGSEEAEEAFEGMTTKSFEWWKSNIDLVADEHACYRPVAIAPTPGYINNGIGKQFVDTPENRVIAKETAVESIINHHANLTALCEEMLRTEEYLNGWTEESCIRTLKNNQASIDRVKNTDKFYPAYQSVEIYLAVDADKIPQEVLDEFSKRVYLYAEQNEIEVSRIEVVE